MNELVKHACVFDLKSKVGFKVKRLSSLITSLNYCVVN